ncbi:MAG: AAA family ATPase [Hyphomicrobiaceae bacterium]
MKLHAVRLSEVGHFRTGVALEGLSGRLDVVPGPNEMGKSTIFRAIETVFQTPYTGTAVAIQDLAPVQGGAPLIEIEFELGGTRWRLRKRYLAQRLAELTDLSGRETLRGADAENRLVDLVAGRLGRKRLLDLHWVRQRHGLELPKDDKNGDITKSLGRLIEDEIADAAGEGQARRVREAATKALNELVTPANRARARVGRPYKAAIDLRDQAQAAFEKATNDAQAAAKRHADLQLAQAEADRLAAPEAANARVAALAALRKSLDDGTRAARAMENANLVVDAKQAARDQARARLLELTSGAEERSRLRAAVATTAAELALAAQDVERLEVEGRAHQIQQDDVRRRIADCQRLLDLHDLFERRQALSSKCDDLMRRLASARTASERIAEIDAVLAAEPVTDRLVADLRRTQAERDRLQAQLSASLPKVRIDYAAGGAGRIHIAGTAITGSGEIESVPTLVLDVEGVGRITIAAPTAAADELTTRLMVANRNLQSGLASANVSDIDEAEARLFRRQKLIAERLEAGARVAAEAPDGLAAIEQALSAMAADVAAMTAEVLAPQESRSQLAAELSSLRSAMVQSDSAERANQTALLDASRRQSRLMSEQESLAARLARLDAALPPSADIPGELAERQEILGRAEAELNTAVLERSAWSAGMLAPAAVATLQVEIAAAVAAEARIAHQRQQLALDIAGLESALMRDRQDGVEAILEDARAALGAAEARVATFQREVSELELLERLLGAEALAARASELKPVVDRLQLYASGVFPEAKFELDDVLAVSGLARQGLSLSGNRLSGGTSEQIAVLVRLAYARLLADRGEALPLVLDDALVYADAGRFGAMFAALEAAAEHHQVIMLTCHEERVAAIGAGPAVKMIAMQSWSPAQTTFAG